jgi:streptomycin 6-kinase
LSRRWATPIANPRPTSAATSRRPPGRRSPAKRLPPAFAREWAHEPAWLGALPALVEESAERWGLELEEPFDAVHGIVVPAGDAVLKLNAPSHHEAEHEADALAFWDGGGAVRLLARNHDRRALLVERCRPGTQLWDESTDELAVAAELLPRLWGEPPDPHPFLPLVEVAAGWAEELRRQARGIDRSLVDLALDTFGTAERHATSLANQDLHGGNILRAEREPWLVVDPKPLVGERELNGVGLLRNAAWNGGTDAVRDWLDLLAGLGLDRSRVRAWGVAHALAWSSGGTDRGMVEAARAIRDA